MDSENCRYDLKVLKLNIFFCINIFFIQDNLEYIGEVTKLICDDIKKSIKALNKLIVKGTVEYLNEFREKIVIIKKIFIFYLNKIQVKCNPDIILISDVERILTNFYI